MMITVKQGNKSVEVGWEVVVKSKRLHIWSVTHKKTPPQHTHFPVHCVHLHMSTLLCTGHDMWADDVNLCWVRAVNHFFVIYKHISLLTGWTVTPATGLYHTCPRSPPLVTTGAHHCQLSADTGADHTLHTLTNIDSVQTKKHQFRHLLTTFSVDLDTCESEMKQMIEWQGRHPHLLASLPWD